MVEIRMLRFLLFRPAGLVALGALFMGLGATSIMVGRSELPERVGLKQVSGVLDAVKKIRRQRLGNVNISYELHIKSEDGRMVRLILSEEEITEEHVQSLASRRVTALFSRDDRVWELSSGATKLIDYEATRRQQAETQAFAAVVGPYVTGGGILISF